VPLALALKAICDSHWATNPLQAGAAATALTTLASLANERHIDALAAWANGIAAITRGAMEEAIVFLDQANSLFQELGMAHTAASTQISKLIALGILGRYDEATRYGMQARDIFLAHGDTLAAAKIEQNLGVMAWRRDRYHEAEQFLRAARDRFAAAGEIDLLVAAENALAADLTAQFRLREAAAYYAHALALAKQAGLELRQAEIECNLGNLALAQGRYHEALDYLEQSRRRYAAFGMPHELAYAEQELAEAYLSLNMAPEAAAIYARITPTFQELGMRSEQAWALAHHGQAAILLARYDEARSLFDAAHSIFVEEENQVSAGLVTLFDAQLAYQRGDYSAVVAATEPLEQLFSQVANHGRALLARWLRGESLRALGEHAQAWPLLEATLSDAEAYRLPQIAQRCYVALGLLSAATGDHVGAETALKQAITIIEGLRAPLPSEEFRTAFTADKFLPYRLLIRLCLISSPPRVVEALAYAEQIRARTLADLLGRSSAPVTSAPDSFEAGIMTRLAELQEELNWLYRQFTQRLLGEGSEQQALAQLDAEVQQRETTILELSRQLQIKGGPIANQAEQFDLSALQASLDGETIIVDYLHLEGEVLAFIVTSTGVEVVPGLAQEAMIEELVSRLRFQIDAVRRSVRAETGYFSQLLRRAQHYLQRLYQLLLEPLMARIGQRRLVVIPHGPLHYVPFHALYDGHQYLIEQREVSIAPSLNVLLHCLARPRHGYQQALLMGVPDAYAPHVRDEIEALAPIFGQPLVLLGHAAQREALRHHAPTADIIHLACHGTFRPDNPLFSALHLADGRFTTRDAYTLDLHCDLVVLSACETGVTIVASGDELIGLARGFFAAGTPAMLVSLWTVDDAHTTRLMTSFYTRLQAGDTPAQALRFAQRALMSEQEHPFFWAPFVLMGRW
jgi:CHAT domain-containing protein